MFRRFRVTHPFILLALVLQMGSSSHAFAAAWTQEAGHSQFIYSHPYYNAGSFFDAGGHRQPQGTFVKHEENLYAEYGLRDGLTVGGSLSFNELRQKTPTGSITATGFTDPELFIRKRLWRNDHSVFSLQPLVKVPLPHGDGALSLGTEQPDAELRALYGYGVEAGGLQHFADVEAAYRVRGGAPSDELHLDATLGLRPRPDILVLGQAFSTFSVNAPTNPALNLASCSDYDLVKLQLSAVKTFHERYAVQAGVFDNIAGKNTGAGGGAMISLWVSF